ncbi:unnamed protein product, partial [Musa textilis]
MVNLRSFHGAGTPAGSSPRASVVPKRAGEDSPRATEGGRPKKRSKAKDVVDLETPATLPVGAIDQGADRLEASTPTEGAGPSQGATGKSLRPPAMKDLCRIPPGKDQPFLSRVMGEVPPGGASDPLVARWGGLSRGDKVWAGGNPSATYLRGALHPDM